MDTGIFGPKLENHAVFKCLKENLKESNGNLRNLMELKDDVLYVWDNVQNCLLAVNLKYLEEHEGDQTYQKLHLLHAPSFEVERILGGACGTRVCVWGPRGVVVVELPSRWGKGGLFDGGKGTILCKSFALDEKFLYSQGEVRRVHWHPTSLSHVLVLLSDNTIRLYNIALKSGPKLVKIINIGPKPSGLLAGKRLLDSLGDTAVDFTTLPESDTLLVLRGNGDVYVVNVELQGKSTKSQFHGPLTMYPPADDNYGESSCCIMAVGSNPSLVIIATCSHVLYHCLLLPTGERQSNKTEDEFALYVIEAVELDISLTPDQVHFQYSYPVHLYPCSITNGTYACVHAAGVHVITLPIMEQLKDFMLAGEDDMESALTAVCSKPSHVRYLICTRAPGSQFRPPCGLCVTNAPITQIAVLCEQGQCIVRALEPSDLEELLYKEMQLKNPSLEQDEIKTLLKERQKLSFSAIIQEILSREVSQPLLNTVKKDEPSAKESLEFLTQATLKFRQEYMARQKRAVQAIGKKAAGLKALNSQQVDWYNDLQKELDDVQLTSAAIREKLIIAEKHQDDLKYRCSSVIRALRSSSASNPAERELMQDLEKFRSMRDSFTDHIERLKVRVALKEEELKKWKEDYKKKDIALGKSHSDTISSILQQQTSQISTLIEEAKLLKDQLGIF